jgi:hypothetical protein
MKKKQRTDGHCYSSKETEFLKKIAKGKSYKEINTLFNERFGLELTYRQIVNKIYSLGRKKRTSHWRYSPEEIQFLKKNVVGRNYAELTKIFNEHFCLTLNAGQVQKFCCNHKWGRKKKGLQSSIPIGFEVCVKGTTFVKVPSYKDEKKCIKYSGSWKRKHNLIWENAHGPIPKGHMIIFADGNKQNFNRLGFNSPPLGAVKKGAEMI